MKERVCKNCGGREYKVVGQNMVKCAFCGTLYVDEQANKEEEVLIVGARELVREFRFDEAVEEFEKIISIFPQSFESFFGKALAKNKIMLYPSKKGTSSRARFFGQVVSILEDEDFLKAVKLAPQDTAASYQKIAKQIEKIKKDYAQKDGQKTYDIIMCAVNADKENSVALQAYESLKKSGKNVYFLQDLPQKEYESQTFCALEKSKCFLFFAQSKSGYADHKHLLDRWQYFVSVRQKPVTSFVLAIDEWVISKENLPREFGFCKNFIDTNSISFLQDVEVLVETELENFVGQTVKIDTVKLKKISPKKKKYVDVENVTPIQLGHYDVENVSLTAQTKIKWIYLSLKNGDFSTAQEIAKAELEKDPYNSQLLFAELLAERKIKSEEDFFSSISNFSDKEKIDNILRYASKSFAENFVDKWESLIESLDMEEYYCAFLLYLAAFQTPERESFIKAAEAKAIETQNESLIEDVQKCFDKNDVNRFIEFYFALAQKSDSEKYYQKILDLDAGHLQSNMVVFLRHFKSTEAKLSFHDRQQVEEIFKYLDENGRLQLISAIVDMILSVAFYDLEKAEKQLDFYLAYITDDKKLVELAKNIAMQFQQMSFFTLAEKYVSIAISKDKHQSEFYWLLIQIKAHCKSDKELIMSEVKVTQMPEWQSLLEFSEAVDAEYYAGIVSKANLYKGKRTPIQKELLDKVKLAEKLQEFLLRNFNVLLEIEKQEKEAAQSGVNYFRAQLMPLEKYISEIDTKTFDEYCTLVKKIRDRLRALDLNLNTSISVTQLMERCGTTKVEALEVNEKKSKPANAESEAAKPANNGWKSKFLKRFLCIFLEFYPLLFTSILLAVTIVSPKAAYLYFSQEFLILSLIYSVAVAMGNLAWWAIRKHKSSAKWRAVFWILFIIGALNVILFAVSFYFSPKTVKLSSNVNEMQTLMRNAKYANFELTEDVDFQGKLWESVDFYGTFDGKGKTISNICLSNSGFFETNAGHVKNLAFKLIQTHLSNPSAFGVIASKNRGKIEACFVSGTINVSTNINSVLGGIVGINNGGIVERCETKSLIISVSAQTKDIAVGGLVGFVKSSDTTDITQNAVDVNISVSGNISNLLAGGLVGNGENGSHDNYAVGKISTTQATGGGFVGGLYGKFRTSLAKDEILHSYANVKIETQSVAGCLVGFLGGTINSCFGTAECEIAGEKLQFLGRDPNCEALKDEFYKQKFQFDENIWEISSEAYPKLLWQKV